MIYTDRTITVRKGESKIDEPIVVYRGDYELEVRFTITNSRFKFMSGTNLIETEKASFGQMAILTPYGGNIFSDIVRCSDGTVTFVLTESMINQIEEIGLYSFQIRLYDYNKESRVSIPPIEFGIEVREPIASEDHDNSVNNAIVGYSIAKVVDPKEENVGDTFNESGNYNKTKWETGDRISEGKLNKIEDAIDKINENEVNNTAVLSRRIDNNFNVLDSIMDEIKQNSQEKIREIESELAQTNAQLSEVDKKDINRRIIYVDDFGAKGDGSDDTIAIKKAVEHLAWQINSDATTPQELNSGGILKFTEGNYKFDDVVLPMGTRVEGEGMWNTRITNFTKGKSAFKLERQTISNHGAHACIFSNLNIYGGTHNNDIDLAIPVISYDSLTSVMFEQIWIIGAFPIKVANCTEVMFESCIFDESIRHLYLFNCNNVNINNLQCYRSVQQSLVIKNCNRINIDTVNFIALEGGGLLITDSSDINIGSIICSLKKEANIYSDSLPIKIQNCDSVNINSLIVDGKDDRQIVDLRSVDKLNINHLNVKNGYSGVVIDNSTAYISNVYVDNVTTSSVRVSNLSNVVIDKLHTRNTNLGGRTDDNEGSNIYCNNSNVTILNSFLDGASKIGVNSSNHSRVEVDSNTVINSTSYNLTKDSSSYINKKRNIIYVDSVAPTGDFEDGTIAVNIKPQNGAVYAWVCYNNEFKEIGRMTF